MKKIQAPPRVKFLDVLSIAAIAIFCLLLFACEKPPKDDWIVLFENTGDGGEPLSNMARGEYEWSIKDSYTFDVIVGNNCVEYNGAVTLMADVHLSLFSYKIIDDTLYLHLRADLYPYYADSSVHVNFKIEDKRIKSVKQVVLWDEIEGNHVKVWDKINGVREGFNK